MSLWSKIEPLCLTVPYASAFPDLINGKKYGYIDKESYGVCGYYQEKFLLIAERLFKAKCIKKKEIYHAVYIDLATCEKSRKVFKCFVILKKNTSIFESAIDQHRLVEKEFPLAVAKAPYLLGMRDVVIQERPYVSIDTMEDLYRTTLSRSHVIKRKLSLGDALKGLLEVAKALEGLHKKNFVHRDVKNWNFFVQERRLLLFDFDLARAYPDKTAGGGDYLFWDLLSRELGLVHPFCDVYGWTVTLGIAIWGKNFYSRFEFSRHQAQFLDNLEAPKAGFMNKVFYEKIVEFIKRVIEKDLEAYTISKNYLNAVSNLNKPDVEVTNDLYLKTHAILPKMQDCIDLIRPWV